MRTLPRQARFLPLSRLLGILALLPLASLTGPVRAQNNLERAQNNLERALATPGVGLAIRGTGLLGSGAGLGSNVDITNPERPGTQLPSLDEAAGLQKIDLVVPLAEFFNLRPPTLMGNIKAVYVDRDKVLKLLPLDKDAQTVRAFGVSLGTARVTIVGGDGQSSTFAVRVVPSLDQLNTIVKRQFPRAKLRLTATGDKNLFVEGSVDSPGEIDPIIDLLRGFLGREGQVVNGIRVTGIMQVQLHVCIARVDRTHMRNIGVNFLGATNSNVFVDQVGNLAGVPTINVRGGGGTGGARTFANFTNPGPSPTTEVLTGQSTFFFGTTTNSSALFGFLELLKTQGLAKILANPTLVTLNGRPADFLVGGEQPFPSFVGTLGGATPTVEFKAFGTRLSFLPVIMGDGKIRLDVVPEVSRLTSETISVGGIQVPRFETQRLHATVEMENGQTLALGGLLQSEDDAQVRKYPVLGDIPYLGTLFRRVSHATTDSELLVIVTPRLCVPMDACERPPDLPGAETRRPDDCEFYLHGMIEAPVAGAGHPDTSAEAAPLWHGLQTVPQPGERPETAPPPRPLPAAELPAGPQASSARLPKEPVPVAARAADRGTTGQPAASAVLLAPVVARSPADATTSHAEWVPCSPTLTRGSSR